MAPQSTYLPKALLTVLMIGLFSISAVAEIQVIGVQYLPDRVFPEDNCIWHDRQYPGPCSATVPGAYVKVFVKNIGQFAEQINDATLAGYSLKTAIEKNPNESNASSIYFHWGFPPQALLDAGEPVWFKADPATTIPTGGVAQVVVRLRYVPTTPTVAVGVAAAGDTVVTNIARDANTPQLASVGFSPDRTKVYLYWRRANGAAPDSVWMDGTNVTANTTTVGDPAVNFAASVIQLPSPLPAMSFHVYQGVYADGRTAAGGLRTWVNPFLYGTWGAPPNMEGTVAAGQAWINEATAHGCNVLVYNWADGLGTLLGTSSGRQYAEDRGYGFVIQSYGQMYCATPRMWFIFDEPDGVDPYIAGLPPGLGHNPGVMAMEMIGRGESLRSAYPLAPTTINIDGNLKPYNYWNWGQVPDVFMSDAYYDPLLADAYWNNNSRVPLYRKATYIYASTRTAALACEPNPLHMILYSCSYGNTSTGQSWPFAPPASKRIEVYYALAAGAKGMAYWWYLTSFEFNGLGADTLGSQALWKEIGLLGNEIKTAQPLLVTSHPVELPMTVSSNVWARPLAVGTDTLMLLAVNDNYSNDVAGCHYTPVSNATVAVTLPMWMQFPTAFEISARGLTDVTTQTNGNQLVVSLSTLNVTKMIVLTRDPDLRAATQARYITNVWPGVCTFSAENCSPQPPYITRHPANAITTAGGAATFTVSVLGSATLRYQWQKNQSDLANGGHYSGCTTATLTITNADAGDVASYRCVVTNAYGTNIANAATLSVTSFTPCIANAAFENGFTLVGGSYLGNGWTKWESTAGVVTGFDETATRHSGGHSQRIRVWNSGATNSSGGVYQSVPVVAGINYSISVWMYAFDNLSSCYLGVNPSGGTNPNSGVIWSSVHTNVSWVQKAVSATATASNITVYYKVVAPDLNKRNGYFDDAAPTGQRPLLTAQRNGTTLTFAWPDCPSARLERAGSLSSLMSWTSVTNPVSVVDGQKTLTLSLTGNSSYFRLILEP